MYQSDLKHPEPGLQEKLEKLYTLNREKTVDLSFRPPFLDLLEAFGNPHLNLPPVIHVAGTNGKGSTIAILRSIYEAAGYKTHTYTSPHLIRFNERITLAGQHIDNNALESLIDEALALNEGRACTFFEITTAIAFAAFSRVPADICLLEVGLGGRLDCTNVIERPALTIITPIGLDHTEHLGETINAIASEKAGIMKSGVPCIIAKQNNTETLKTFDGKAAQSGAKLIHPPSQWPNYEKPALSGVHQTENANTALTAIQILQDTFPVSDDHINEGLRNVTWPARFQALDPKIFGLPIGTKIYLDGGHNKDAANTIAAQVKERGGKAHLILCMMKHKDPKAFLEPILPHIDNLTITQIPGEPSSLNAGQLKDAIIDNIGKTPLTISENYKDALRHATDADHIIIAGSLYFAGHVLQDIENAAHT